MERGRRYAVKPAFVKALLTGSLLLNLVVAGTAIGVGYRAFSHPPLEIGDLPDIVSAEKKDLVQSRLAQTREEIRPLIRETRRLRGEIEAILGADTFDAKAFSDSSERMHALQAKIMNIRISTVRDLAQELSPQEREALAQTMLQPPGHRHRKHGKKPGPKGENR